MKYRIIAPIIFVIVAVLAWIVFGYSDTEDTSNHPTAASPQSRDEQSMKNLKIP